jgi:probable rRNA maturation factor
MKQSLAGFALPNPSSLIVRGRQRARRVDLSLLHQIALALLTDLLPPRSFDLGVHLVSTAEITRLNQTLLHHAGSTDVITLDYAAPGKAKSFHGEIFICVDEAVSQARRFRTTWTDELVRYLVHGVLHLLGYDDSRPEIRRRMKREEDRLLRKLARRFPLRKIGK